MQKFFSRWNHSPCRFTYKNKNCSNVFVKCKVAKNTLVPFSRFLVTRTYINLHWKSFRWTRFLKDDFKKRTEILFHDSSDDWEMEVKQIPQWFLLKLCFIIVLFIDFRSRDQAAFSILNRWFTESSKNVVPFAELWFDSVHNNLCKGSYTWSHIKLPIFSSQRKKGISYWTCCNKMHSNSSKKQH